MNHIRGRRQGRCSTLLPAMQQVEDRLDSTRYPNMTVPLETARFCLTTASRSASAAQFDHRGSVCTGCQIAEPINQK